MAYEQWHPASEPPDTDRLVMLRFSGELLRTEQLGYYGDWYGASGYTCLDGRMSIGASQPTHWRELMEDDH